VGKRSSLWFWDHRCAGCRDPR